MRFIDEVQIHVVSGRGGDGVASFRREMYVPYGGPDGGDGGMGGDVVLVGDRGRNTLLELRSRAVWKAGAGQTGRSRQKTGAGGKSCEIRVPIGTRVFDEESGEIIGDVLAHEDQLVVARGGARGLGNVRFKSSTNRAPRQCSEGKPGEERRLRLELMLMADVGLLGFPNAGKSTLMSRVSAARPKIGAYPFTTRVPSLGVVSLDGERSFVMADIPGLIEGASEGHGLGHQFLRHVRRTRVLLHLVSMGPDEVVAPEARYQAIRAELEAFDPSLSARPEIIVLTKGDLVDDEEQTDARAALRGVATEADIRVISAVRGDGLSSLMGDVLALLDGILEE